MIIVLQYYTTRNIIIIIVLSYYTTMNIVFVYVVIFINYCSTDTIQLRNVLHTFLISQCSYYSVRLPLKLGLVHIYTFCLLTQVETKGLLTQVWVETITGLLTQV